MFTIGRNGIITANRGDKFIVTLNINNGTELEPDYTELSEFDAVYLGVMEPNCPFEHAIITKKFTEADVQHDEEGHPFIDIVFKPTDTEYLVPGVYYYECKLLRRTSETDTDYSVDTIIPKTKLIILE